MRAAVVLLALANLACLTWFGWLAPPQPPGRPSAGGDLVVINDQAAEAGRCFVLQPPLGSEEGRTLAARLEQQVERVAWEPPETHTAYWVHQPPLASIEDARSAVRRLQQGGFDGAALATGRGWTNVVVVGVFEDRRRAVARRDAIRANGFKALVSERQRELRASRLMIRASNRPAPPQGHQWVRQDCAP
jgi:hypothetical protein